MDLQADDQQAIVRLDALNRIRVERTLEMMSQCGQQVFHVLPLLLHYHHPVLPGFVSTQAKMPTGIVDFHPNPIQQAFLDEYTTVQGVSSLQAPRGPADILGIYTMGSIGSIGQGRHSDLDVWICLSNQITLESCEALKEKCAQISVWASRRGLEVHFFHIYSKQPRWYPCSLMEGDGCGSALHFLLLDEFYRSAVKLAGIPVAWLLPEHGQAKSYALQSNFGDLDVFTLPAEEYFGAGLWQLYKAVDSPYKSLLKTMLIEAYSYHYPNASLLCNEFYTRLYQEPPDALTLDSYLMMFEYVSQYLISKQDFDRLALIRRCFYLKARDWDSIYHDGNWQAPVLEALARKWGWSVSDIEHHNHPECWNIGDVKTMHCQVVACLMQSHQQLVYFAHQHDITSILSPEDMGILSRKIAAVLGKASDKIELVNLNIAPNIEEHVLHFVQHASKDWGLYTNEAFQQSSKTPIKKHASYTFLASWAYFNGVMTPDTQIVLHHLDKQVSRSILSDFCRDIARAFPEKIVPAENAALSAPCSLEKVSVFLNLQVDPTVKMSDAICTDPAAQESVFAYGQLQKNLVGSVDIVYMNSWHEMRTISSRSPQAVLEATVGLLKKMHVDAKAPEIQVFCYADKQSAAIVKQFEQWLQLCFSLRVKSRQQKKVLKIISLGSEQHSIIFDGDKVETIPLASTIDFYQQLSKQMHYRLSPTSTMDLETAVLDAIYAQATENLLQFFSYQTPQKSCMIMLDEQNKMEIFDHVDTSVDTLVQNIIDFYKENAWMKHACQPLFYTLKCKQGHWHVVPYQTLEPVLI